MLKMCLLFFLFSIVSLSGLAQSTGHPGGGGPDFRTPEDLILCQGIVGTLHDLEQKFCDRWNKPYKTSNDFFALMDQILLSKSLHTLKYFKVDSLEYKFICQKVKSLNLENILNNRYSDELITLNKLQKEWNRAFEYNFRCGSIFNDRIDRIEELKLLIKMYEQSQN
jgi:hypothetical protein